MRPPRLATWLLLTFGSGPDVEVIAGDLSEQYAERSRSWYWRQVAYAIVLPRLVFLIRNSIDHERFLPYLRGYVAGMPPVIAIVVTGVLLGALCGRATYARVR